MKKVKSKLNLVEKSIFELNSDVSSEIIDDSGLIDCINALNFLRDSAQFVGLSHSSISQQIEQRLSQEVKQRKEREILSKIQRISSEMTWFSQWLTVKSNTAA